MAFSHDRRIVPVSQHWRIGFENGRCFNITFRRLADATICAGELLDYADWMPGQEITRKEVERARATFRLWCTKDLKTGQLVAWIPQAPIAIEDVTRMPLAEDLPVYDIWEKYPRQEDA